MTNPRIAIATTGGLLLLLFVQQWSLTDGTISHAREPVVTRTRAHKARPGEKVITIPIDAAERQKSLRPFMHAKVGHSQRVFEGLVTKDFGKIETAAEALMLTSLNTPNVEPGAERNDEVFEHLKLEFLRLSGQLKQMASDENLEGAAYVTEKLNSTCISCHQYLRDELPRIPAAVRRAH